MNDLEKIKSVLANQQRKGVKSGDWRDLTNFTESKEKFLEDKGHVTLHLEVVKIGLVFTLKGQLIGIYNWQP